MEELDPVARAFHEAVSTGRLSKDHIYYKLQENVLAASLDPAHQWDEDVASFLSSVDFHGSTKVLNWHFLDFIHLCPAPCGGILV